MDTSVVTLTNRSDHYSFFQIGDLAIKFYTSPYLEYYSGIDLWDDRGYLEYKGKFSTGPELIEDSIDLAHIAERLHLSKDIFKGIKEIRII